MASNIIDLFYQATGSEFISKVSSFLGESTENTSLAIKSFVPSLLGGLVKKNSKDYGAAEIFDFLGDHNYDGSILSSLENTAIGDQGNQWVESGEGILEFIFGPDKNIRDSITDVVSSTAGINTHSGEMLIKLISPMVMDIIGKEVSVKTLDIPAVKQLFEDQKENIKKDIPASVYDTLGLKAVLDVGEKKEEKEKDISKEVTSTAKKSTPEVSKPVHESTEETDTAKHSGGNSVASRIIPWIVLIALAILLFYVMRTCGGQPESIKGG